MNTMVHTERSTTLEDSQVLTHLTNNKDFLKRYPDLIEDLEVSQGITGATSLLEHQTSVLRTKVQHLENQLASLIKTARRNEQILNKLHYFTLELLRADSLDMLLSTSQDVLRSDFNADFVSFRLFQEEDNDNLLGLHFIKNNNNIMKTFHELLYNLTPVCGVCPEKQLQFLFGDNSSRIESVALVPLHSNHSIGLLALGSTDANHFHKDSGTVFLSHLGQVVATAISQYIEH